MSQPMALLEMAGADMTPNALSDSALVLIDCQMEYVSGAVPLPGVADALAEAGRVLARARAADAPIVHVVHQGQAGSVFDLDGAGGQIAAQVASAAGEAVIRKELPNAFAATGLHDKLQELGAKNLIFVGFMTHMCVSASVRAALDHRRRRRRNARSADALGRRDRRRQPARSQPGGAQRPLCDYRRDGGSTAGVN